MSDSLYEKLGGSTAVASAVNIFYRKVLQDDSIKHFFDTTDMSKQMPKQKAFLTMAFGGSGHYTGKDMREAHAPLVAKGLKEVHFTAVAGHLQATLEEMGVAADLVAEVMAIAGSTHDDVLGL